MSTSTSGSQARVTARTSPATSAELLLSDEARAATLWTFLHARVPRFTLVDAAEVIVSLRIDPREDHKTLAKRLRKSLQSRGIALKHSNSLQAAARLVGRSSWYDDMEPAPPCLQFHILDRGYAVRYSEFASWSDLADALRAWVDNLLARGQIPLGVLAMSFTGQSLQFSVPVPSEGKPVDTGRNEMWPLGGVTPIEKDNIDWLAEAPAAIEKLRRHIEETGKAVLDGFATLFLCAKSKESPADFGTVATSDVVNSELVLIREPDEGDPQSGYEIARGDELTCWHQLELSLRDDGTNDVPERIDFTVPAEGVGAWFVNGVRYVWILETLKPREFVPGRIDRQLGISDCSRLLRRYKLAKRIHSGGFRHHDMTKRVDYLSGPPETWRVDLHRVLHILSKAGLTWDSYIEKYAAEPVAMDAALPVGFVMQMLEDLSVEEPNKVFAWPTLAEMALVTDDKLLCSLLPRVDAVRYSKPRDLDAEAAEAVHTAVDEFASALQFQKMVAAGAFSTENELPYLVHASEAQEVRMSAEAYGLQMYIAVLPHLTSTKDLVPGVPGVKTWPWAFGHALAVRFERKGATQ